MAKQKIWNSPHPFGRRRTYLAPVLVALLVFVAAGSPVAGDSPARLAPKPAGGVLHDTGTSAPIFLPLLGSCDHLEGLTVSGPATGTMGLTQTLTATVSPASSRLPITYTWRVPGQAPVIRSGGLQDVFEFRLQWTGTYPVEVEATNGCGNRRFEHLITLTTRGMVAFERQTASGGPHDLWLIDNEGSGTEFNLTNTADIDEGAPTWSPDGSWLAYSAGAPGSTRAIYKLDLSSGEVISLTNGSQDDRWPAWSPTGGQIAFMRNQPGIPSGKYIPDIYVMNTDGTEQRQLTDWLYSDDFPAWSPDGEWIVFATDRDFAGRDLWRLRPDDPGNLVRVTATHRPNPGEDLRDEIYPTWSPDGWIYHTFKYENAGRDSSELLYRIREDGIDREKVFDDEYNRYIASVSPDGACFVFYSTLGDRDGTDKEVWKWCEGYSEPLNLTDNDVSDEFCAWSPAP